MLCNVSDIDMLNYFSTTGILFAFDEYTRLSYCLDIDTIFKF